MRLGISPFASGRGTVEELCRLAVDGGLDTLWLGDGLLANDDFPGWAGGMESFCELAWLAGRFPAARIGISAAVLPLRDVHWTVKQVSTLAHLAGGGFVCAVAPGFWPAESAARGVDHDRRGADFEARLDALRAGLGGRPHPLLPDEGRLAPVPPTGGAPPVWLAGARATMRRAAALGLPYQGSRLTPADLAPLAAEYHDRGGVDLAMRIRLQVGEAGRGRRLDWHAVEGPPAALAEAVAAYADLGVVDLSIVPGQDDVSSLRTLEALVGEVVPALRR